MRAAFTIASNRTHSGSAYLHSRVDEAIARTEEIYAHLAQVHPERRFSGRVAEIGPGDSIALGLELLANGCEQVDLADRFYSSREDALQVAINKAMIEKHPQLRARLTDDTYTEDSFVGLTRYYGKSASSEFFFDSHRGYDTILSNAVLEHVHDVARSLRGMAMALHTGGYLIHQVDLRDHEMFTGSGRHPLSFLTLSDPMYGPFRWGGGPNRVPLSEYRRTLDELGMYYEIFPTILVGNDEIYPSGTRFHDIPADKRSAAAKCVREALPKLRPRFKQDFDDLCVSSFTFVARK
jgi:SAM-dependent methyltransferase